MLSGLRKSLGRKQAPIADSDADSHADETGYDLHPDSWPEGGLTCRDEELLRVQGKAVNDWVKAMSKKLLSGSVSLSSTPFPVSLFEPRSYLEKLADTYVYPRFLKEATSANSPVERLKLVGTWLVSGLHKFSERWKKPFNPILGETWQAEMSDGTSIYIEQISHHPPISAIQMEGPGWKFTGTNEPVVGLEITRYGFKAGIKGLRCVEFADGSRIDITLPSYVMRNVVYSKHPRSEIEGEAVLTDLSHGLKLVMKFGAVSKSSKSVMRRSDAIYGELLSETKEEPRFVRPPPAPPPATPQRTIDEEGDEFESADETDFDLRTLPLPTSSPILSPVKNSDHQSYLGKPPLSPQLERSSRLAATSSSSSSFVFSKLMKGLKVDSEGGSSSYSSHYPQHVLSIAEGSWVSHLEFDDKRYWNLVTEVADAWQPSSKPLMSDSRFRQDLAALAANELNAAQAWKDKLEDNQRHDKKLRAKGPH